ncbi:MAG: hypothetical protein WBQ94_05880 [Terracidiphilus sp.]
MKPLIHPLLRLFDLGLLGAASILVPAKQRVEWGREWRAELWHVRRACAPVHSISWCAEREVAAFCLGAFQDALCLRRQGGQARMQLAAPQGSAAQCVLLLATVMTACYTLALLLPGVRAERNLVAGQVNPGLVLIQSAGYNDTSTPTVSPAQYRAWKSRKQEYFDGYAFYRVTRERVERRAAMSSSHAVPGWGVAHASANLFGLLGLPLRFAEPDGRTDDDIPNVILSEDIWTKEFGANPHVTGSVLRVGTRLARIAGVAPNGFWKLPGKVDAWLMEPDSAIVSGGAGYVVAHLTDAGRAEMWTQCVHITAYKPDESEDDLLGISIEDYRPGPWTIYLFASLLALLALPAITSVSLGEYSPSPQRTSWSRRIYRWSFLCVKIAMLLPIVYFASLDLGYALTTPYSNSSMYIQLVSTFAMCLFGLRWVLQDQRKRCPVCLRRVEHPAQVGQASRTFLAWNGTELMCMDGHTLLHVPGMPTSWFGAQRWLYLDTSWEFLFAGSGTGVHGVIP